MQCNVYKVLNSPDNSEQLCTPLDFLYSHCIHRDKKGDFTLSNVKDVTKTKLNS